MTSWFRFLHLLFFLLVLLALCAVGAAALLDWLPGVQGLPPDIAAIQLPAGEH